MSVALSSLRARVRVNLDEMSGRKSVGVIRLDQEIRNQYRLMMSKLPPAWSYTAAAGTITAGSASFTLPTASSAEYAGAFQVQLVSDLSFLTKISQEEMRRLRAGNSGRSRPRCFAPYEDSTQGVVCWVHPLAASDESYNLFRSLVASDTSATDIAAATLAAGRDAQDALVAKVSAAIAMSPGYLKNIDPDLRVAVREQAQKWDADGEGAIYREAGRLHRIEGVGRIMRLVS